MQFHRIAQSWLLVQNRIGKVSYRGTIVWSHEDCEMIVISYTHPCGKWHRSGHDVKVMSGSVVSIPSSKVLYGV